MVAKKRVAKKKGGSQEKRCSWCRHLHSKHYELKPDDPRTEATGCLYWYRRRGFCRCSAERGRV